MPVTFIGDVHGWSRRLDGVTALAVGEMVFMGDLIDRGPDAPGVLARVRRLCADGRARCLLGNHEYALLRGLGAPSIRLEPDPHWFELWRDRHGGSAVLASYGVRDAAALRQRMGADLIAWIAALPWCLQGDADGSPWIAVHAGMLPGLPLARQLADLADPWRRLCEHPDHLYDKLHVRVVPDDMPQGTVLVSGHLPLPEPLVSPSRILCDTSGGMPGRQLSGVVWPSGQVVSSR